MDKKEFAKNAADLGKLLGGQLLRIGREPYDPTFQEKKKSGNYPFLPEKEPMKYFIRRTNIEKIEIVPSLDNPNEKFVMFNGDRAIQIPIHKGLEPASEQTIADTLRMGSAKDLDQLFFGDEKSLVDIVTIQNNRTIAQLDSMTSFYGEIIDGLKTINKSVIANYEERLTD